MVKIIQYLRKFLAAIVTIIPSVKINPVNYPFSKEFKALNQDFISIGNDIKHSINKNNEQQKK